MDYLNLGPQKQQPKQQDNIPIILWIILGIALFILCYLSFLYISNRIILYMVNKNKNNNDLKTILITANNQPEYDV